MQSVGPSAALFASAKPASRATHSSHLSASASVFHGPRRSWWSSIQAILSFATGVVVLQTYAAGCSMSLQSLLGTHFGIDGTKTVYAQYESPLMLAMVESIKTRRERVVADLHHALQGSRSPMPVAYLVPSTSSDATFEFSTTVCPSTGTIREIHAPDAVLAFVGRVLLGLGDSSFPLHDAVVLIDCRFGAISDQDSSTFRAHVVDRSLTYITTMTAGALVLQRPLLRETTVALPVIVVNITFDSIEPVDAAVRPPRRFARALNSSSDVRSVVAIRAPFATDAPFELMFIDAITDESQFEAHIYQRDGSSESVTLMGTDGVYVEAENVFGSYYSYCFDLPLDAVENLASLQFLGVPNSKNAYAWGYAIVTVYLCIQVSFVLVSAVVVAFGSAGKERSWVLGLVHGIPDISHQLQAFLGVHALLSIGSCVLDRGWGLYEWCDASSQLRTKASRTIKPLPAHVQCLLQSWVVVICHGAAKGLRINFSLTLVIVVTALFHAHMAYFNGGWGLYVDVSAYVQVMANMDSLIPSHPGHMDVWLYHTLDGMDIRYVLNETSAYIWATCVLLACEVAVFVGQRFVCRQRPRVVPDSADAMFLLEERLGSVDVCGVGSEVVKRVRSTTNELYVTVEWAWYLGYVVVDHSYLFKLHDVPKLCINVLFNVESFYVYGYHVSGNQVTANLSHFHSEDFPSVCSLCRLSLRPLRQDWPMNETKRHLRLYDEADRRLKAPK
ncbi:hypothetical protein DYB32_001316 [Aphanomyces invadans]|uniref:Transmembrane protein n=1 Tax=Aphanomyces invadans TaxID=157072 RepID=A0A418B6V0_9STRA|nr:hypothetical protein DYB32_001316 [Aphanomyces invadans]